MNFIVILGENIMAGAHEGIIWAVIIGVFVTIPVLLIFLFSKDKINKK